MRTGRLASIALCALVTTVSPAGSAAGSTLGQAIQLYNDQQLAAAIPLFDVVSRDDSQPTEVRALANLYLGLAKASLGDREGARAAFAMAFTLSPMMALPPGAPAEVAALAEESRPRVTRAPAPPPAPVSEPSPNPPATAALRAPAPPPPPPISVPAPPPPPVAPGPENGAQVPVEAPPPPAPEPNKSGMVGLGTGFSYVPLDKHGGPELTILFGEQNGLTRLLGVAGILFGVHNAYSAGLRMDIASRATHLFPVSFGGGLDFALLYQTSEPAPLLMQGMLNLFNVAYQWKQLLVELRAVSVGLIARVDPELPWRLQLESTLAIYWLPSGN